MVTRRRVLQGLGVCIALPLLESAFPRSGPARRARPVKSASSAASSATAAPMPDAANGDWGYAGNRGGALKPLQDLNVEGPWR